MNSWLIHIGLQWLEAIAFLEVLVILIIVTKHANVNVSYSSWYPIAMHYVLINYAICLVLIWRGGAGSAGDAFFPPMFDAQRIWHVRFIDFSTILYDSSFRFSTTHLVIFVLLCSIFYHVSCIKQCHVYPNIAFHVQIKRCWCNCCG